VGGRDSQLGASRYLVLIALVLIILATGIAWMTALTGDEQAATQEAVVVTSQGASCGTLTGEGGALSLEVDSTPQPVAGGANLTLVDDCP
jgi:hypothetical protein